MPNKATSVSLTKIDYDLEEPYIKIIADVNCFKTYYIIDTSKN